MGETRDQKQAGTRDAGPGGVGDGQAGDQGGVPAAPPSAPPPSPPPPRGPGLAVILTILIVGGLMLWIGSTWGDPIRSGIGRIVAALGGHQRPAADSRWYTCGMHPNYFQRGPGLCPICHMELTPVDPSKLTGELTIDPVVVQNIGVRVAPVVTGPVTRSIRTVGTVDYNETAVRDVNIKLAGWIEKLHVTYLGEKVEAGQPLLDLYAPDLFAAQQEYLLAYKHERGRAAAQPDLAAGAQDVLAAARTRLAYYDISDEQIRDLERRGEAAKTMTLRSPFAGVVIEKEAFEGMRVEPGTRLLRIADLSAIWVMVTLYEYQLPFVQVGQKAVMTLPYIPGQQYEGKVIYIYPTLDPKTRQVRVRLEFANPAGLLKPGMFAEAQLHSTLAQDRVLAPREAVIDTGQRQVAFVSLGEGKFEPRDVQMGVETENGMVQVLAGLKPGEMVVTSGQFLLDSESRVREALAKMIKGQMAAEQPAAVATAEPAGEMVQLPAAANEALAAVLDGYFVIGRQLADDTLEGVPEPARRTADGVDRLLKVEVPADPHFWHKHEEVATVRGKALELAGAKDLVQARLAFADLTIALDKLISATGVPSTYPQEVQRLHCPMYREGQGGSIWLQPDGPVRNPFYGKTMLECFDKRFALPVAGKTAGSTRPVRSEG